MSIRSAFLAACTILFAAALSATADPFAIAPPLSSQGVFSCSDLTMSSGIVDSRGVVNATPANRAVIRSNGNVRISGGTVNGDAIAGPGKLVQLSGSGAVTGTSSSASGTLACAPIDLAALQSTLQATNDNARIPLTTQGKNPLTGASHTDFTLSGGDSVTLPAGTYYFTKISVSGGATVTLGGAVRILCTGRVDVTGGSFLNASGNAYNLRLWVSGAPFNLSSSTLAGFVYAPVATATVSAGTLKGGLFANAVTVSGSAHITQLLDDAPPHITIDSPPDNSFVTPPTVVVSGTASDGETGVAVTVNGQAVSVDANGSFQTTVTLTGSSPFTITAVATDGAGNTATATTTLLVPAPSISSVSPIKGPTGGGTSVTITGANFRDGTTSVSVGGTAATSIHVLSTTALTATTPSHSAGPADVVITTPGGTATKTAAFTYFAPPIIASLSPAQGSAGTTVAIAGQNFDPDRSGDQVLFGGIPANIVSATTTQLVVTAPSGVATGKIAVTTAGGSAVSVADFVVASFTSLQITAPTTTIDVGQTLQLNAVGVLTTGGGTDVTTKASWSANSSALSVTTTGLVSALAPGSGDVTATLNGLSATMHLTATGVSLPPDPATIAPKLDRTVVATLADETRFLYSGPNAIQTGVAPGAINDDRATIFRGRVIRADGSPLAGVTVTVLGHPEYGQTISRADGMYDLVINGGAPLTVKYTKHGFIAAQRLLTSRWAEQRVTADVALVAFDPNVTLVGMNAGSTQVARGGVTNDDRGTRQATLLFPAGITASLVMPDGRTTPAASLSVRATEFTVGPQGPNAMPAALPPTSAYTYCAELSADEAEAAGASSVKFSNDVSLYVNNFLGVSAGTVVPFGYYDRLAGKWMAGKNGVILKILSVTAGLADLDIDGSGSAASASGLAAIGIDDAERAQLAKLYTPGQSLWRLRTDHFTPVDPNFAGGPPVNSTPPNVERPQPGRTVCDSCTASGSIIDIHNQALGESIPITGTPYSLDYSTLNTRRLAYRTKIQLTGTNVPQGLRLIVLDVAVAGRAFRYEFAPQPNLSYDFAWDGVDAYGRAVQGGREAEITISYLYPGRYFAAATGTGVAWNTSGGQPLQVAQAVLARLYPFSQTYSVPMGQLDATPVGFGGWTLSAQRIFDGRGSAVYASGGVVRSSDPQGVGTLAMKTVAGNGGCCRAGEGGPATQANLFYPVSIGFAADGTYYLTDGSLLQKVDTTGILTTVGGTGRSGFTPDGTPILGQPFNGWDLAVSPDGVLYVNDQFNARIRAVVNGKFVTVAGNGQFARFDGTDGWGGPATQARLPRYVEGITVGPDGTLYLASDNYILRVEPDGRLVPIAGGSRTATVPGDGRNWGDEGPALSAGVEALAIAAGPDGSVYFTDGNPYIRRITPDGIIHLFAGTYNRNASEVQDGQPATSGSLNEPWGITVAPDGSVLVGELGNSRVRRITPDGIITTLAGNGRDTGLLELNGTLARAGSVSFPWDVKVAPDGSVYLVQYDSNSVSRLDKVFPAASSGAVRIIPADDGASADVFEQGRHTRTIDTTTGATLQTLTYDSNGYVTSIADRSGNVTTFERDALGNPAAIVAPGGRRTTLTVSNGQLTIIADPAGQTHIFTYNSLGLMDSMTDPRGGAHTFTYDAEGALLKDADPAGGFTTLLRTGAADSFTVQRSSAEGRTQTYGMSTLLTGDVKRTDVGPDGLTSVAIQGGNGVTTIASPDGTQTQTTFVADPRFGMMAPLAGSTTVTTPGGLTSRMNATRSVQLADRQNSLSMTSVSDTVVLNGRTYTDIFDVASRKLSSTTPAGRTGFTQFDGQSRPLQGQFAAMAPWSLTYDAQGRLTTVAEGNRSSTLTYDAANRLASVTDPLSRTLRFAYDEADRVTAQTLPDGQIIAFAYDANGNVTSVTPPTRPAHTFALTPVDLVSSYAPPVSPVTQYAYNKDRQITSITRPDRTTLTFAYDPAGRPSSLTTADGTYGFTYDAAKGVFGSMTAPNGTALGFSYDGSLLLGETWTGPINASVSRSYNSDFRITSESVGGATFAFTYDADSLLMSAGALNITRDPQNGLLTGTTLANIADSWSYNNFGEPITYGATYNAPTGPAPIMSFAYTRDDAGRITQNSETYFGSTTTTAYGYDATGRLATVTTNGALTATYTYDQNGNRLSKAAGNSTESASYDGEDRLLTYNGATFTYTQNGELSTKVDATGTTSYTYDAFGNLAHVALPDGRVIDYVIDPVGRRIGKKINGALVQGWLYADQTRIIAETDSTGAIASRFVYGSRGNSPDYMIKGGVTYRILSDHLGSPRALIDVNTGAVAWNAAYDEFGRLIPGTPDLIPFGFAGGLHDSDTQLVHFGARDYDPQTGRWTAKDPIGFDALNSNLYSYVGGDPINLVDPSGLKAWECNDKNIRDFLSAERLKRYEAVARRLGLPDQDFVLAVSAWESTWGTSPAATDSRHNFFGMGRAATPAEQAQGKNRVLFSYKSENASIQDWVSHYGEDVRGAKTIDDFINRLEHRKGGSYNTQDAKRWRKGIKKRYNQINQRECGCD